jgi:hypothetical protein
MGTGGLRLMLHGMRLEPLVRAALRFFSRDPVTFLKFPDKLLALSIDLVQIVIGQFPPFLLHGTLHLFPLSCDLVPIHVYLPPFNEFTGDSGRLFGHRT